MVGWFAKTPNLQMFVKSLMMNCNLQMMIGWFVRTPMLQMFVEWIERFSSEEIRKWKRKNTLKESKRRKGKEKKGKERKGKERKGKERKGKEI